MATTRLYPLSFTPILKRLIWGGRHLGTLLGKSLGPDSDYAESWEISDHRADVSIVADGPLAGASLRDLIHSRGAELLGTRHGVDQQFPLLVKFLDAQQVLSVQVHPDDTLGARLANDNGKTEAWVILGVEPGGLIYAGLQPGVTQQQFAQALQSETVEPLLHRFTPRVGDCIFIPAGTVHAIGAGVLLVEVQQMSDATFRVYDWGRTGVDGRPRPLHIEQALAVTDFRTGPVDPVQTTLDELPDGAGTREVLVDCHYFRLCRYRLQGPTTVGAADRFTILVGLAGSARLSAWQDSDDAASYPLELGETRLLPAAIGPCRLTPDLGAAIVLACDVPPGVG